VTSTHGSSICSTVSRLRLSLACLAQCGASTVATRTRVHSWDYSQLKGRASFKGPARTLAP
jgi:hypothetical protein